MRARLAAIVGATGGWRGRVAALVAVLAGVAALGAASHGQASAGILKLRMGGDLSHTRVVVELGGPVHGRLVPEVDGKRLTLALDHVGGDEGLAGSGQGLVSHWRVKQAHGEADLSLTFVRPTRIERRFLLPPDSALPVYRYIIDLAADAPSSRPTSASARTADEAQSARKVVVIDAGHGGGDPGAAGARAREKDLTLAAARMLRDRLVHTGRYKVVLTRDGDSYVSLERRVEIARRANADLFISLHADSDPDRSIRGAAVYTLSEPGAGRVAKHVFENADWFTDLSLPGPDPSVNRILLDLTQRDTRSRSSVFAENLLGQIANCVTLRRRSHRAAGFMVLLAPDVPAVLLEMGFITNPQDEVELSDPVRRARMVEGVAQAIDRYFGPQARLASR